MADGGGTKQIDKLSPANDNLPENSNESGGKSPSRPQQEAIRNMSSAPAAGTKGNEFCERFAPNSSAKTDLANIILADTSGSNNIADKNNKASDNSANKELALNTNSDVSRSNNLSSLDRTIGRDAVVTKRDGLLPSEIRNTVLDNDGNTLLQVRTREGNTNRFDLSEYSSDGKLIRTEKEQNVHINDKGQVEYSLAPNNAMDFTIQLMLGQSRFIAGDLPSAKEHFLDVASEKGLFNGNRATAENYINMYVNRMHKRVQDGYKAANDDQLASSLRSLSSVYETERTGNAKNYSQAKINDIIAGELKSLGNPEKYNNQGQVGSCYLNTCLFIAETLHPEAIAKMTAKALTTGTWRGHQFDAQDMKAAYGRNAYNQFATSAMGKTFGFGHMTPGFRGTTETEAQHAYKALTHDRLPIGRKGLEKYDIAAVYTYGGAHAQADFKKKVNGRQVVDRENWWNGYAEGRA